MTHRDESLATDSRCGGGMNRICPVCWQEVSSTTYRSVLPHFDKVRRLCPASDKPWRITMPIPTLQETA